jgi:hypothetical protein
MLAVAQALTDVQTAALSDTTTVTILFKDGTSEIVDLLPLNDSDNLTTSNSNPPSASTSPLPQLSQQRTVDAGSPTGRTALLFDGFPMNFSRLGLKNPTAPVRDLVPWFENAAYTTYIAKGTPDDLSNVKGGSAFVLNAHGAFGVLAPNFVSQVSGNRVFAIATPVPATTGNISQYLAQIQKNEMGYYLYSGFSIDPGTGAATWTLSPYLFITPQFVRNYMTFTTNSVLFMNVCSLMSQDPAAEDMVNAFFDQGAGVVLGWDAKSDAVTAVDSGWFFLDRVLGAGATSTLGYGPYTTSPANRPFNVGAVYEEMHVKPHQPNASPSFYTDLNISTQNLDTTVLAEFTWDPVSHKISTLVSSPPVYAHLKMQFSTTNPPTGAPALVPSISTLNLQNNLNQLTLTGDFGGDSTNRMVTIGTATIPATWTNNSVTITSLPLTADGNVQVTIDGAKSNQVLINQWNNVPLTMITGPQTVTCSVNLRTSFDSLRQAPDQPSTTSAVTTDDVVLQNGTCSFVSSDPAGGGDLPWFDTYAPGATTVPDTFANAWSTGSSSDGSGGGTVDLSIQASYNGSSLNFLETSATKGTGQQLVFDDATGNLAAGLSTQYGPNQEVLDTLQWGATAAASKPATTTQPQGVQLRRP